VKAMKAVEVSCPLPSEDKCIQLSFMLISKAEISGFFLISDSVYFLTTCGFIIIFCTAIINKDLLGGF
jgi:hypothetical protein